MPILSYRQALSRRAVRGRWAKTRPPASQEAQGAFSGRRCPDLRREPVPPPETVLAVGDVSGDDAPHREPTGIGRYARLPPCGDEGIGSFPTVPDCDRNYFPLPYNRTLKLAEEIGEAQLRGRRIK